ncbi:hypothetical protein ACJJID_16430 [Microbulbifer sp. CnH-101-G]|uniref:hypothetical protein n=1 Tax=Microbulbifer sp. CnH-101-G TaxID=3243393 RepID=UPI00403A38B3
MSDGIKLLLITFAAMLSSCATVELTDGGRDIRVVQQISVSDLDKYYDVGEVACSFGFNAKTAITNIKQCRIDLKNQAALLGGDVVVIEHQQLGTGAATYAQGYSGCGNCISMVGTAYKEKVTTEDHEG